MTDINPYVVPEELMDATNYEVQNLTPHRWLYSVVPSAVNYTGRTGDPHFPLKIFLSGFCPSCKTAFSALIPQDSKGKYLETAIPVPTTGCKQER